LIKIFVSTEETQGQRENDFCFVPEGEIVDFVSMTCSNGTTDDNCGCKRAMSGIECHKATTTMKVTEFDGSIEDLGKLIKKSQQDGGWLQEPWQRLLEGGISHASEITRQASEFPVGAVVEYRDGDFAARK
jgi:hypothetical protein